MGVSFKVSKTGKRFRPKPVTPEPAVDEASDDGKESSFIGSRNESSARKLEDEVTEVHENVSGVSSSSISEHEVSFVVNLYLDGYSIGKPSENEATHQSILQDSSKLLHPYDRTSEALFLAIESGRLPGDILDGIPCKYVNGALICEVQDFRKCVSEQGLGISSVLPIVTRVCLRMSLENVVKDIPLISDNSWTYGDLMEVESRILKALQPKLCLDPTPKLDRLSNDHAPAKLSLGLSNLRRKRLRQMPEVTVTSSSRINGKKVCIDQVPESSSGRLGDSGIIPGNVMQSGVQENLTTQNLVQNNALAVGGRTFVPDSNVAALSSLVQQQSRYQMGAGTSRSMQDQVSGSLVSNSGASPAGQDMITYGENVNSGTNLHGKRENPDGPISPSPSFNKRTRVGPDGIPQQQMGPHVDGLHTSDMNWKNPLLQHQTMARAIHYANAGIQKYPQQMFEGFSAGQPGVRFGPKEEQFETDKLDGSELSHGKPDMQIVETETGHLGPQQARLQQRLPQHLMRCNFPQAAWNNPSQDLRKEEQLQKRKSAQSPRVQSPLSSKSGEFSSSSAGPHFGAAALNSLQKDKLVVPSVSGVAGTPSLTSSANDSLQRQHQAQVAAKRRSNYMPKTPVMNGVGSPVSVGNMNVPLNASSPSVGNPPVADQTMLERLSKIEMVTMRHQLNLKKNKVDESVRKPKTYPHQDLMVSLSNLANSEDVKDDTRQLSKSIVGGSMNVCKMRIINFLQADPVVQGTGLSYVSRIRARLIMSEKPNDGTVAMHCGEVDDGDFLSAEEYLPTLPNTHFADLLASQFCTLMNREGYHVEDNIQPKPVRFNIPSSGQPNSAGIPPNNSVEQYNEAVLGQASNDIKPSLTSNAPISPSHNLLAHARMLPPGNAQAVMSQGGLLSAVPMPARPQQLDPQSSLQQQPQQQQHPQQQQSQHMLLQQQSQFQRSPMMLQSNSLSHLNTLGQNSNIQLVNKPSHLQLQLLQQQQQQQQQLLQPQQQQQVQPQQQIQQQRKLMMGAMGMGNMGNNMVSLGGLGNAIGIGGTRGMGLGISGPMASISGMNNVGQNPMNLGQTSNITNAISQHIRAGQMTPAQVALLKSNLRVVQNRTGMLGHPQSGMTTMAGTRQMQPGSPGISMLGQSLNRANMNSVQRTTMGPMGPPKLMGGMNQLCMNQQQQQQLQQQFQQQQQQQQLQQLQQQQQQQDPSSSLQAVVSPPQVGSPSMGIPQLNQQGQQQPLQQPSPQQMSQRTPMSPQLSSGAIHGMSTANPEACPASPQLSSQTLGSVGSITHSPMELQGVNKSNSVNNA